MSAVIELDSGLVDMLSHPQRSIRGGREGGGGGGAGGAGGGAKKKWNEIDDMIGGWLSVIIITCLF